MSQCYFMLVTVLILSTVSLFVSTVHHAPHNYKNRPIKQKQKYFVCRPITPLLFPLPPFYFLSAKLL